MNYDMLNYNEIKNSPDSAITVIECCHSTQINMHAHDFYEFVYVEEGFTVHYYGESTTILTEGDMFAICPGVPHAYTGLHYTKVYNCIFTREAVADKLPELSAMPGLDSIFGGNNGHKNQEWIRIRLDTAERMRITSVLDRMVEEQRQKQLGWELVQNALLYQFITLFSRYYAGHYVTNPSEKAYINYVVKILKYIEQNYAEDIDLNKMAAHLDISPDYLSRQFKKIMGLSPAVFLRSYRLARAMNIIRCDSAENLSDISAAVGYKHLSHFSREFKSFTGVTPSEYKNSCSKL